MKQGYLTHLCQTVKQQEIPTTLWKLKFNVYANFLMGATHVLCNILIGTS